MLAERQSIFLTSFYASWTSWRHRTRSHFLHDELSHSLESASIGKIHSSSVRVPSNARSGSSPLDVATTRFLTIVSSSKRRLTTRSSSWATTIIWETRQTWTLLSRTRATCWSRVATITEIRLSTESWSFYRGCVHGTLKCAKMLHILKSYTREKSIFASNKHLNKKSNSSS